MGGWMDYGRMRSRNGLAWRPDLDADPYPRDHYPRPLPEQGRQFPSRGTCWVCEEPVPPDRVETGTCSEYHRGVWAADCGSVLDRAHPQPPRPSWHLLVGDLNRMEGDYLAPVYPQDVSEHAARRPRGSSPAEECAEATGVDIDTVRRVLLHVFRGSS